MAHEITFLPEARAEFAAAVDYYNRQRQGLGDALADEAERGLRRIEQFPQGWQRMGMRVRRFRLTRFPYGIVYAPLEDHILIVAFMHLHRRPGYWRDRLP